MSNDDARSAELLAKVLAVQLYAMGVSQGRIATIVKKSKGWVNSLLHGLPRPAAKPQTR